MDAIIAKILSAGSGSRGVDQTKYCYGHKTIKKRSKMMPPTRIERMTSAWLLIQVLRSTTELKGLDMAVLSMNTQQKQDLCTDLHFAVS